MLFSLSLYILIYFMHYICRVSFFSKIGHYTRVEVYFYLQFLDQGFEKRLVYVYIYVSIIQCEGFILLFELFFTIMYLLQLINYIFYS